MGGILLPHRPRFLSPPLGTQAVPGHPLLRGVVCLYPFNGAGGARAYDVSGQNNPPLVQTGATGAGMWSPFFPGTYQSLGCVELPYNGAGSGVAEDAYNALTYGSLVTVVGPVA